MLKKPEKLMGYVMHNEIDFPFEFDEDTFSLLLFPPTVEVWNYNSSIHNFLNGFKNNKRNHEWVGVQQLHGVTSERNKIVFEVSEARGNYHGFYNYSVNWYFYYSAELDPNNIDRFKILGEEINYFFPPQRVLKPEIEFNEDKNTLRQMSVTTKGQITESCGKYRAAKNTDANMTIESYATMHFNTSINPIEATSIFVTTFSKPVNLDSLIISYKNLILFFRYITYRSNISIHSADVFLLNKDGERDYKGLLMFKQNEVIEDDKTVPDKIIKFYLLKNKTGKLITNIKNGILGFQHLCDSIENTHHYPVSRIIMILSEFEREFRNIYGRDYDRSDDYLLVKNDVLSLIDSYLKNTSGKRRQYAKQFRKYVNNRDSSFEATLKTALYDCKEVMEPFLIKRYEGTYETISFDLSSRMGEIRNGIAHSRSDLRFDAIHLSDIKIVEELLYAMRLKKMKLKTHDIQKAINDLFSEHMAI